MLENTTSEAKDRATLKIKGAHEAELDESTSNIKDTSTSKTKSSYKRCTKTSSKPRSSNKRCDSKTKCSLSAAARHVYNLKHPAYSRRQ